MDHNYKVYQKALAGRRRPAAFVDLEAFDHNLETVCRRAQGKPVRLATKSIRCRQLIRRALDHPGVVGLMCFTPDEAAWLAGHGFDNLLVAYPTVDSVMLEPAVKAAQAGTRLVLCVDDPAQLEPLNRLAMSQSTTLDLCIDVDMSSTFFGVHFGVRRSPLRSVEAVVALAKRIDQLDHLRFFAVLAYEAQIAGLPDDASNRGFGALREQGLQWTIRALKAWSIGELQRRRQAIVDSLAREGLAPAVVNGGGTGSLESTARDRSVTEVTAGSGLFGPTLFDRYRGFEHRPAAGFALSVVRQPTEDIVTCLGGGYIASGGAGPDRLPTPWLPTGCSLLEAEGAGEVQTPVQHLAKGSEPLKIGDPIFFRHSKAGELLERFNTLHLIEDEQVIAEVPTYRGEGRCFL